MYDGKMCDLPSSFAIFALTACSSSTRRLRTTFACDASIKHTQTHQNQNPHLLFLGFVRCNPLWNLVVDAREGLLKSHQRVPAMRFNKYISQSQLCRVSAPVRLKRALSVAEIEMQKMQPDFVSAGQTIALFDFKHNDGPDCITVANVACERHGARNDCFP